MKAKRTLKLTLCLFTALILILPILSSCSDSAPKLTIEEMQEETVEGTVLTFSEMQDRVLISHNHFNEITVSIPSERFGASIWVPSTTDDPNFAPILAEKYTYKGVEYTVKLGKIDRFLDDCCGETIYSLSGNDENGNRLFAFYTHKDKAPMWYSYGKPVDETQKTDYSEDDAVNAAKKFLDYFINQNSIDRIDISKYTLANVSISENGHANVEFKRYIHNVMVHSIDINLNSDCTVTGYTMSSPIIDENILEQIPALNDEQYAKLVAPVIDKIYRSVHDDFAITNLNIPNASNASRDTYELVYLHSAKCYAVQFAPEFKVTLPDGTFEEPAFLCCYPLYPNTENAD